MSWFESMIVFKLDETNDAVVVNKPYYLSKVYDISSQHCKSNNNISYLAKFQRFQGLEAGGILDNDDYRHCIFLLPVLQLCIVKQKVQKPSIPV